MDTFASLYQKYNAQSQNLRACEKITEQAFTAYVSEVVKDLACIQMDRGVLYYSYWEEGDLCGCDIPLFGYYAEDEKTMVRLFQRLAERVVVDKPCEFSVRLYRSDESCIRAFQMMQFGIMAEKGIRRIAATEEATHDQLRVLAKSEIKRRWAEIWQMTQQLIAHLQKSPVFYPGAEFTEEAYWDFFCSDDVELIAAFRGNEMIGMIEWNLDKDRLFGGEQAANVGEIFVLPQYRGTNLSFALLNMVESRAKAAGFDYLWVEHGTANPNARGFWNKYFETTQYELVRTIKPLI